jgi:2'-5' RNA ligase
MKMLKNKLGLALALALGLSIATVSAAKLAVVFDVPELELDPIYEQLQPKIEEIIGGGTFIPEQQLHSTLIFIGDVADDQVAQVQMALEAAQDSIREWLDAGHSNKVAFMADGGLFGYTPNRALVLKLQFNDFLDILRRAIVNEFDRHNIAHSEQYPFEPHVAVARVNFEGVKDTQYTFDVPVAGKAVSVTMTPYELVGLYLKKLPVAQAGFRIPSFHLSASSFDPKTKRLTFSVVSKYSLEEAEEK